LTARHKTSPSRVTPWMWLEFEFKENIPVNTTAYCLIIHDCVIEYNLLSNTQYAKFRKLLSKRKISLPSFQYNKRPRFLHSSIVSKSHSSWYQHSWICIGKKFIVKEVHWGKEPFSLITFLHTSWNFLTKSKKYCVSWLSAYHELQWEDGWYRIAWGNVWLR